MRNCELYKLCLRRLQSSEPLSDEQLQRYQTYLYKALEQICSQENTANPSLSEIKSIIESMLERSAVLHFTMGLFQGTNIREIISRPEETV